MNSKARVATSHYLLMRPLSQTRKLVANRRKVKGAGWHFPEFASKTTTPYLFRRTRSGVPLDGIVGSRADGYDLFGFDSRNDHGCRGNIKRSTCGRGAAKRRLTGSSSRTCGRKTMVRSSPPILSRAITRSTPTTTKRPANCWREPRTLALGRCVSASRRPIESFASAKAERSDARQRQRTSRTENSPHDRRPNGNSAKRRHRHRRGIHGLPRLAGCDGCGLGARPQIRRHGEFGRRLFLQGKKKRGGTFSSHTLNVPVSFEFSKAPGSFGHQRFRPRTKP